MIRKSYNSYLLDRKLLPAGNESNVLQQIMQQITTPRMSTELRYERRVHSLLSAYLKLTVT